MFSCEMVISGKNIKEKWVNMPFMLWKSIKNLKHTPNNIHMKIVLFTVDVDVLWYPLVAHTSSHLIRLPVVEDPEPYEYRDILI